MEALSKKPRCQHISKIGARCQADPQTGKAYCFFHDPDQKKKQAEARRQGGEARTRQTEPEIILPPNLPAIRMQKSSDVFELLSKTLNHFRHDEMDLRAAKTIAYLASILLRALKANAPQAIEPLVDTINQFRRGQIDLPTARTIGHLASLMLSALKQAAQEQKAAAEAQATRPVQPTSPIQATRTNPPHDDSKEAVTIPIVAAKLLRDHEPPLVLSDYA